MADRNAAVKADGKYREFYNKQYILHNLCLLMLVVTWTQVTSSEFDLLYVKLCKGARWQYLACQGLPIVSCKKIVFFFHRINPILTRLIRLRWLDINLTLGQLPIFMSKRLFQLSLSCWNFAFLYKVPKLQFLKVN